MATAKDARLYYRLQSIAHRIRLCADRELEASGLTTAQAAMLSIVARENGASQRQVADLLGLNEPAVTAMATRLLAVGFIRRRRDKLDGRAWRLEATAAGRAAMRQAGVQFRRINRTIESALHPVEIAALADMLDKLAAAFAGEDAT